MSAKKIICALFFTVISSGLTTKADGVKWSFGGFGGAPYNIPLPLIIRQNGEEVIRIRAEYYSEPFREPIFWCWRITRWKDEKGWELEAVHHKLFLRNTTEEVSMFNITHGLNLLHINRIFSWKGCMIRSGLGGVVAHPENVVRGQSLPSGGAFDMGYYLSGVTLNGAFGRRFYFTNWFYGVLEVRVNPSFSRVPVVNGRADVYNIAFEGIFGIGIDFLRKNKFQ